jgi:hypothetical protein
VDESSRVKEHVLSLCQMICSVRTSLGKGVRGWLGHPRALEPPVFLQRILPHYLPQDFFDISLHLHSDSIIFFPILGSEEDSMYS